MTDEGLVADERKTWRNRKHSWLGDALVGNFPRNNRILLSWILVEGVRRLHAMYCCKFLFCLCVPQESLGTGFAFGDCLQSIRTCWVRRPTSVG